MKKTFAVLVLLLVALPAEAKKKPPPLPQDDCSKSRRELEAAQKNIEKAMAEEKKKAGAYDACSARGKPCVKEKSAFEKAQEQKATALESFKGASSRQLGLCKR